MGAGQPAAADVAYQDMSRHVYVTQSCKVLDLYLYICCDRTQAMAVENGAFVLSTLQTDELILEMKNNNK